MSSKACKYFLNGLCRYSSDECKDWHSMVKPRARAVRECKLFRIGKCRYGEKCKYGHSVAMMRADDEEAPFPISKLPWQLQRRIIDDYTNFDDMASLALTCKRFLPWCRETVGARVLVISAPATPSIRWLPRVQCYPWTDAIGCKAPDAAVVVEETKACCNGGPWNRNGEHDSPLMVEKVAECVFLVSGPRALIQLPGCQRFNANPVIVYGELVCCAEAISGDQSMQSVSSKDMAEASCAFCGTSYLPKDSASGRIRYGLCWELQARQQRFSHLLAAESSGSDVDEGGFNSDEGYEVDNGWHL